MQLSLPLSLLLFSLAASVHAQINSGNATDLTADNAEGVNMARPDWQPVPSKYDGISTWKSCDEDDDCESNHYCLQHLWSYNGQLESGIGCWTKDVCSGSTSFDMFDGRQLQFFCAQEQTTGALATPPWGLTYSNRTISNDWYSICSEDADCPSTDPSNNQQCLAVLWDVTNDGLNYANMMACYNWDEDVCTAANNTDFGQENMNYDNTKFSFYNEYSCEGTNMTADGDMDLPSSEDTTEVADGDNADGNSSSSDSASFIVGMAGFFVTTMMMIV
mmetsp:Transcript_49707/g.57361  ORF Transcript_49707/g.57361 Transcript_49707/m.57361 type:complete len:275 (+) Transcript_49707:45-869(+)|eukprot:CAMPEP_0170776044 /NCGR_PEP_ID=MMETSP0733-20121128/10931_1 /TAXON_ID=186038 /ORGANISM="Fragilariopsis kerguelensis, Strain L26-C5" /LENGTH=274 /DNA_ID=CAMNT_0011118941 /DNA_START=79 /DNA_END=903 /DNA_ORIENTATION=+